MKKIAQITYALSPALLVALTAQAKEPKEQKNKNTSKPNVILIYADDLGYGDLECYGAKNIQTPNVNKLAKNGIRFTNAHATASTSTPSRYSLLTGEYAWRRKDTDVAPGNAGMIIRPEQFTMADMFKSAGYTTCAIGKWHGLLCYQQCFRLSKEPYHHLSCNQFDRYHSQYSYHVRD